jgi:hypothetical protein
VQVQAPSAPKANELLWRRVEVDASVGRSIHAPNPSGFDLTTFLGCRSAATNSSFENGRATCVGGGSVQEARPLRSEALEVRPAPFAVFAAAAETGPSPRRLNRRNRPNADANLSSLS